MVSHHGTQVCASGPFFTVWLTTYIMKKVIVLPVHGMGVTEMNYAEELRANLSMKLGPKL